jgi:hypothetical protein
VYCTIPVHFIPFSHFSALSLSFLITANKVLGILCGAVRCTVRYELYCRHTLPYPLRSTVISDTFLCDCVVSLCPIPYRGLWSMVRQSRCRLPDRRTSSRNQPKRRDAGASEILLPFRTCETSHRRPAFDWCAQHLSPVHGTQIS